MSFEALWWLVCGHAGATLFARPRALGRGRYAPLFERAARAFVEGAIVAVVLGRVDLGVLGAAGFALIAWGRERRWYGVGQEQGTHAILLALWATIAAH